MDQLSDLAQRFISQAPACDGWTLRLVAEESDHLEVRQGVVEPSLFGRSLGAMITLIEGAGIGYAATSDLSPAGLRAASERALDWARAHARSGLFDAALQPIGRMVADYRTQVLEPWESMSVADKLDLLQTANQSLEIDDRILDWSAWLTHHRAEQLLVTSDGGRVSQVLDYVHPGLFAVANEGSQTQRRHGGGADGAHQGGLENLAGLGVSWTMRRGSPRRQSPCCRRPSVRAMSAI